MSDSKARTNPADESTSSCVPCDRRNRACRLARRSERPSRAAAAASTMAKGDDVSEGASSSAFGGEESDCVGAAFSSNSFRLSLMFASHVRCAKRLDVAILKSLLGRSIY